RGIGVPANSALAIKLFEKAASQKYPPALNALGYYYYNYQYSSHKHQSFFRDKAITGYIALHTNLKWCHGRHVDNNYVLLDPSSYFMGIWCNDANAQFNLARFLLDQIGPRYDIPQQERGEKSAQIMRLLLLASRNGHLSAQQHLQIIHNNIKNLLSLNKPLNQDQLCSLGFLLAEGRQQLATTWSNLPFWKPEWKNEAPTHQQLSLMLEEWYQKNREIMGLPENDQNLSKESIYLYFMDRHWDILSVEEDQQTRLLKKSVSWGEQVQSIEHKKYLAERCKQLRLQDAQGYWNRQVSSQLSLGGVEESKVEELAQEDAGLQQTLVWLQQQALILTEPSAPSEPFFDAPPAYHQIAEKEIPDFIDTAPQDEKVDNNEAAAASLLTPLSFSHESKSSSFEEELSQLTLELSQLNDLNTELTQKNAHLEQENAHLKEENRQLKNSQNEERVFSSVESRNDEAGNISAMLQQMLEGQRRQEAQTNQVNINLSEQNAKLQQMVLDLQRQIAAISVGQQGQQQISNSAEPGAGATSAFFK
ncbi:MAG: hypothetical protein K0Q74_794, partial [Gammaproteobacteria bacterium]|nr:hypothetical protein [Gammaproteobacteria bacterium]